MHLVAATDPDPEAGGTEGKASKCNKYKQHAHVVHIFEITFISEIRKQNKLMSVIVIAIYVHARVDIMIPSYGPK